MTPRIYVSLNFMYNEGSGGVLDVAQNLCRSFSELSGRDITFIKPNPKISGKLRRLMRFISEILIFRHVSPSDRPAVILYPNYFFVPFFKRNIKHVVVVHDLQAVIYPRHMSVLRRTWLDLQYKLIKAFADGVVFISKSTRDDFFARYGRPKNHAVIYNPVMVDKFQKVAPGESIQRPYAIANFHFYPHKNIARMLYVFAVIKQSDPALKLVMTGAMPPLGTPEHALLQSEGVMHLGYLAKEKVNELINTAEFFISMSEFEGFNMSAAECAVLGKPLILSDIPAHRELFDGWAFLVDLKEACLSGPTLKSYLESFDRSREWVYSEATEPSNAAREYLNFLESVAVN
jgi:glycosyltransferase involved in cell wall biosynthesis